MSIIVFAPPFEFDPSGLNQEVTQLEILDKLCDLLGQSDNGWFEYGSANAVTAVDTSIFTTTVVPAAKSRYLAKVEITCSRAGRFTILKGATVIGSGHLSATTHNYPFFWVPAYTLLTGETVEVKFNQDRGTAALVDVFVHGIEK
jgi:hypothetical protein